MTASRSNCPSCGASLGSDTDVCPSCGSATALTQTFERVHAHPDFERWMHHVPLGDPRPARGTGTLAAVVVLVILGAFGVLFSLFLCPPMAFLPFAVAAIGLYLVLDQGRKEGRLRRLPVERRPARVLDDGARILDTSDGSQRHEHRIDLELEGSGRRTLEASPELAGSLRAGDLGVAYLKEDRLIEFARLVHGGSPAD